MMISSIVFHASANLCNQEVYYGNYLHLCGAAHRGNPLLELRQIQRAEGLNATLLAKLEYLNPAGSAKDRVAKAMLDDAEAKGLLKPGAVIIEPTSGNTALAWP